MNQALIHKSPCKVALPLLVTCWFPPLPESPDRQCLRYLVEHLLYLGDKVVYRQMLFAQLSDLGVELGVAVSLELLGRAGR